MQKKLKILRETAEFLKVRPDQLPNTLRRFKRELKN